MWLYAILSSVLLLLALCRLETSLQYTAKMFTFYLAVVILAIITFPVGLIRPFNPNNHKVLSFLTPYVSRFILGMDVEVRGIENTHSDKPFVLLLNHQSSLDAFIMMFIWPDRCVTVMKRELLFLFPFGTTAWLFGSIFINRSNKEHAQNAMKHAADELKDRNVKICMYPEGTRNRDGHMLPFKKGAFNLAVEAQVPVVPATISSIRNFYWKKANKFTDGKVIINVLKPITTSGKQPSDVPAMSDEIRDLMVESYERTSAEVGADKFW